MVVFHSYVGYNQRVVSGNQAWQAGTPPQRTISGGCSTKQWWMVAKSEAPVEDGGKHPIIYPLVNCPITMERSIIFHAKIHELNGDFP